MLVLDFVVAVLLVWTIIFCWKLNKKIAAIHGSKQALEGFVGNFDRVIGEADRILRDLKHVDRDTSEIRRNSEKAQHLIDELSIITTSATRVAERLERMVVQPQPSIKDNVVPVRSTKIEAAAPQAVEQPRHAAIEALLQQIAKARQSSRAITQTEEA